MRLLLSSWYEVWADHNATCMCVSLSVCVCVCVETMSVLHRYCTMVHGWQSVMHLWVRLCLNMPRMCFRVHCPSSAKPNHIRPPMHSRLSMNSCNSGDEHKPKHSSLMFSSLQLPLPSTRCVCVCVIYCAEC